MTDQFDQFFLDTIMQGFTFLITGGFLRIHPWVMGILASLITIMFTLGFIAIWIYPHPIALGLSGQLLIRGFVLIAIAKNWLTITDGFLNSVVQLGLLMGGTTITVEEFLSPGRMYLLGTRLSYNLYLILTGLGSGLWFSPFLLIVYSVAFLAMWAVWLLISLLVMGGVIEFQLLGVFAFLMWPLMTVSMLAAIAFDLSIAVLFAALRLAVLAALLSFVLPLAVNLGLPEGDITVQSAMALSGGMIALWFIIRRGLRHFGEIFLPGAGLWRVGMAVWLARGR